MLPHLKRACEIAAAEKDQRKNFLLACVGIRTDGAVVFSKNGAVQSSSVFDDFQVLPNSHAETRCLRKLGKGGTLFVARVLKKDGSIAMARPCQHCQASIRAARIEKVFYTVNSSQYGIWYCVSDTDKVFTI